MGNKIKSNSTLLYHLLFGGRIEQLADKLGVSKSAIHRVLDIAKKDGVYDWTKNKKGELSDVLHDAAGDELLPYLLSLTTQESEVITSNLSTYKKVMVLPDIHYPDNISLVGVEKFMADYKPDVIVYLGDLLDLRYISHFEKDNKFIVGDKLKEDYNAVGVLIDKHIELSRASEVYFIEGNHEYRVKRFLESYPQGTGFIEIPNAMHLVERGVNWVELNKFVKIGHVFFTHGLYYNVYHAKKHLDSYQRNIIYGHTHAWQVHSGMHPFDRSLPHVAKSIGCLCEINPSYMKNRPNQWMNCFYIAEIETDGTFTDTVIPIVSGSFRVPGLGRRYNS